MNIIYTTTIFDKWFSGIRDNMIKRRLQARIDRIEDGHFGDCKPVGSGVSELRCFFGGGLRIYYCQQGNEIVILLAGGDKSSQQQDIETAIALMHDIEREEI